MKKMLSLILALVLMLSLAIPAFATTNVGGNTSIDVKAKYNGSSATPEKISVDIAWGAMEFTYNVNSTNVWDPSKHEYSVENSTSGTWSATGNTVTVTNHSNVAVNAGLTFNAANDYNTVTGTFDNTTLNLPSAEGKAFNDQTLVGTSVLTLSGTLGNDVTTLTKIGTITVAIAKNA